MVAVSSYTAHMDPRNWKTQNKGQTYPLETFWPERFLTYEPQSCEKSTDGSADKESDGFVNSAAKRPPTKRSVSSSVKEQESSSNPKFSLDGLSGIWIPFGGGYSLCPGRHLAKIEILLVVALLSSKYDFEIVEQPSWKSKVSGVFGSTEDRGPELDMKYFGMGLLPPKNKVLAKIRRVGTTG